MRFTPGMVLVLAACTPSIQDELTDLNERAMSCGTADQAHGFGPPPDQTVRVHEIVACMNAAWSAGTVAMTYSDMRDSSGEHDCANGFEYFTDGGRVRFFRTRGDCYDSTPDSIVERTCDGPFVTSSTWFGIMPPGC